MAGKHFPTRRDVLRLGGVAGFSLLSPGFLAGCGSTGSRLPSYSATIDEARAMILKAMADSATSSVTVALVDGETVVWREAFGFIDKAARTPATPDTMFAIGSVSKVIAAIATMILVDRGHVALDTPLASYLPAFRMASADYTRVTVRMLISHTSGFPGTEGRGIFTFHEPVPGYADGLLQTLAASRLKHTPGELAVYCNDGFTMIELLVRAVAGKPYAQFVADEILAPLAMAHSRYTLHVFADGTYAPAYLGDVKQPQEIVNAHASGGLYSTPSDMSRLAMMLMNGGQLGDVRILSSAAVAEMGRDQTASLPLNPVPTFRYGLGWDGVLQPGLGAAGVQCWHKNGGTTFYGSEFFVAPAQRLAVMLSGTSRGYHSGRIAEFILLRALAERGDIAMPAPLALTPPPAVAPSDADISAMAGSYGRSDALHRFVPQDDRTLSMLVYTGGNWVPAATGLRLRNDGHWSSDAAPGTAYRTVSASGLHFLVRRVTPGYGHYLADIPAAQRFDAKTAVPAAWQARTGKRWFMVNEHPLCTEPAGALLVGAAPELPGYVLIGDFGQVTDPAGNANASLMCQKTPMEAARDLNDVVVEARGGEEWMRIGPYVLRPQSGMPSFAAGTHAITIGAEGYAEWRRLPPSGAVSVSGASACMVYSGLYVRTALFRTNGTAPLPGQGDASYLLVYGAPGATVMVLVAG
jgi:CubicO group peptidase (beta-lactamase class C family)